MRPSKETAACIALAIVLTGCLGTPTTETDEGGPGSDPTAEEGSGLGDEGHEDQTVTDPDEPEPDQDVNRTETDDEKEEGLPPGGPRDDEVWQDHYVCVGPPGMGCLPLPPRSYSFHVEELYDAVDVELTMEAGAVLTNGLYLELLSPDGERVQFGAIPWDQPPPGGSVSIRVDDPSELGRPGDWTVRVWTVDTALTAAFYEVRVSFMIHPDHDASGEPL